MALPLFLSQFTYRNCDKNCIDSCFPGHTAPITPRAITPAKIAMIGKTSIAPAMKSLHREGEGDIQ